VRCHVSFAPVSTLLNHTPRLRSPDLAEPHILRSLANVPAISVHTSHSGCHAVVLDKWGTAYLFGRNASSCLGVPSTTHAVISEQEPRTLRPAQVGAANNAKFVSAACGRSHTLLITDEGEVYCAGNNTLGQVRSPSTHLSSFWR
jgi:alpha-tubulin suppressor-like RCC1 family protein